MEAMSENDRYVTSRKDLQQLRVGASFTSSAKWEVDTHIKFEYERAVHRLEAFVLQEHLADDSYSDQVRIDTPTSTWQFFKHLHQDSRWLGWLVRRRPVKNNTHYELLSVTVERYANYPEANVALPRLGRPDPYELMKSERTTHKEN